MAAPGIQHAFEPHGLLQAARQLTEHDPEAVLRAELDDLVEIVPARAVDAGDPAEVEEQRAQRRGLPRSAPHAFQDPPGGAEEQEAGELEHQRGVPLAAQ